MFVWKSEEDVMFYCIPRFQLQENQKNLLSAAAAELNSVSILWTNIFPPNQHTR